MVWDRAMDRVLAKGCMRRVVPSRAGVSGGVFRTGEGVGVGTGYGVAFAEPPYSRGPWWTSRAGVVVNKTGVLAVRRPPWTAAATNNRGQA